MRHGIEMVIDAPRQPGRPGSPTACDPGTAPDAISSTDAATELREIAAPEATETLVQWVDRIATALGPSRRQAMQRLGLNPGTASARRLKELARGLEVAERASWRGCLPPPAYMLRAA
ncbi:hypothetical protein ACQPZ8_18370 [Actinomadura nitritigenes]|uniref:hypothetical protein n=1 Tax=Actinomadura nitritigenes TaxID=134602 RepID=UPI003D903773